MRLIEMEQAVKIVDDGFCLSLHENAIKRHCRIREGIKNLPTIEAEPVRHGRWKKRGNEKTCPECGFIYYSNNDDWNYCPNCACKMDGGSHD